MNNLAYIYLLPPKVIYIIKFTIKYNYLIYYFLKIISSMKSHIITLKVDRILNNPIFMKKTQIFVLYKDSP